MGTLRLSRCHPNSGNQRVSRLATLLHSALEKLRTTCLSLRKTSWAGLASHLDTCASRYLRAAPCSTEGFAPFEHGVAPSGDPVCLQGDRTLRLDTALAFEGMDPPSQQTQKVSRFPPSLHSALKKLRTTCLSLRNTSCARLASYLETCASSYLVAAA